MSNKIMGNLLVIAAPSGAGKTTLVTALASQDTQLRVSVSHTTRPKRPGEIDGEDYFFIDTPIFQKMIKTGAFLEHALVYDYYYGTSREWVLNQLHHGIDVILEIDWQGARQVRQQFPEAILIFILPPSIESLEERLKKREQDQIDTIKKRMQLAQAESGHFGEFDYLVVNDQFEHALRELQIIAQANRLKTYIQAEKNRALLESLLKKR